MTDVSKEMKGEFFGMSKRMFSRDELRKMADHAAKNLASYLSKRKDGNPCYQCLMPFSRKCVACGYPKTKCLELRND